MAKSRIALEEQFHAGLMLGNCIQAVARRRRNSSWEKGSRLLLSLYPVDKYSKSLIPYESASLGGDLLLDIDSHGFAIIGLSSLPVAKHNS